MLVVRGGTIIDGTGTSRFVADLAVGHDGKIAAIGPGLGPGTREIDAIGKLVIPGFVDVHTHFDAQVCWDPYLRRLTTARRPSFSTESCMMLLVT